jgi:hypothetical protein
MLTIIGHEARRNHEKHRKNCVQRFNLSATLIQKAVLSWATAPQLDTHVQHLNHFYSDIQPCGDITHKAGQPLQANTHLGPHHRVVGVRIEHDDSVREDVRSVRILEGARIVLAVALGELFHEPIDLLGLPGEAEPGEEAPDCVVEDEALEAQLVHVGVHHLKGQVEKALKRNE